MNTIISRLFSMIAVIFGSKKNMPIALYSPNETTGLLCPPTPCSVDLCCGPTVTYEEAQHYPQSMWLRVDCGNMYDSWKLAGPVPMNRAQRRDRNFGVMINRDGSLRQPLPNYVALQPKRLDGVR